MGHFSRHARQLLLVAAFAFTAFSRGSALAADEFEDEAAPPVKKYTATAYLQVERHVPHILPQSAEKDDPGEFEYFRATQMQLVKSQFVIIAALRDPKVQKQPSIQREEDRHHAVAWLEKEIHVKCPDPQAGVLTVSLTSSDPQEAAVLVNAVVAAYMNEFVNGDRLARRERLWRLQQITAEKENEVRIKREQLRRELENIGVAGDDQTAAARVQLAMTMSVQFQSELQRMKSEHRILLGELAEAKERMTNLPSNEIAAVQVAAILNNNPTYHEMQSRIANLELEIRRSRNANPPDAGPSSAQEAASGRL